MKVKKKTRGAKNRAKAKSIDAQYLGPEPVFEEPIESSSDIAYSKALSWYNYMFTHDDAQKFILTYLKNNGASRKQLSAVRNAKKNDIVPTCGWQAKMMNNGVSIPESSVNYFNRHIDHLVQLYKANKAPVTKKVSTVKKPSIQERMHTKANEIITDIEEQLDTQGFKFEIYKYLINNDVPPKIATIIKSWYEPVYEELCLDDPDVRDNFANYRKERRFWKQFMTDIDRFVGNKKTVRKSRKKKTHTAIDIVKHMKYQKEDASLKIVSVHPTEIIGANQVWVYNTKYRTLTVYNNQSPDGLQVHRSAIKGYDVETSVTKKLRKPEEAIPQLLSAGKVALRKFMAGLTTKPSNTSGRINNNSIILRVIK